jgi:DNA polymerase III epsilon subunit-like protein
LILFYDVESTGLYKDALLPTHPDQPKVVQLAAILAREDGGVVSVLSAIVKPEGWEVPLESTKIHRISHEHAENCGVPAQVVMACFNSLCSSATRLVGHNLRFDMNLAGSEFARLGRTWRMPDETSCTMLMAKDVLKLPPNFPRGDYRWPTLESTYEFLFEEKMEGAHDALADASATLKIYFELTRRGVPDAQPLKRATTMRVSEYSGDKSAEALRRLLEELTSAIDRLPDWEKSFVADITARFELRGDGMKMSERQWSVLNRMKSSLDVSTPQS